MTATDRNAELHRIAARHLDEQREHTREVWRDGVFTALTCMVSCAVGLFFVGLAVHVTDYQLGMIYFWSGLVLGYIGMIVSLHGFYKRGEERGQW